MRHAVHLQVHCKSVHFTIYTIFDDAIIYYRKIQSLNKGSDCNADHHSGRTPLGRIKKAAWRWRLRKIMQYLLSIAG